MENRKKVILPLIALTVALFASIFGGLYWYDQNVDRSGWREQDGQLIYRDFHGRPVYGWLELSEGKYFFDKGGVPKTGWQTIDDLTCYFGDAGVMSTGWQEIDGNLYYFGANGVMVTDWLWLGAERYYFRDGILVTGWQELNGSRYYFDESGLMAQGLTEIYGNQYYFDSDGKMATGWVLLDDGQHYFDSDGVMITGLITLEAGLYKLDERGVLFTGWEDTEYGRRYFLPHGPLALGWQTMNDGLRYFDSNGIMAVGWQRMGEYDYYFHEDGHAAIGPTYIDGALHYFTPKGIEIVLVNANNPVPSYYQSELIAIQDYHRVDSRCFDALSRMLANCNAAGITYNFNSAFRSIQEQTLIMETRTQEHMDNYDMDYSSAYAKALQTVAVPGTSEHHLGLAVDLLGEEAIAWFTEHCWEYGFIVRYQSDKIWWTGIIHEPWHFRYVGVEVAMDLKDSGLCLEEYLGAEPVAGWWTIGAA